MTEPTLRVLSLGAGRQSTTLALMSAEGLLPKLDAAVFADTGWEPDEVYENLDRLEKVLTKAGIPLYRVGRGGRIQDDVLDRHVFATLPAYTLTDVEVREPLTWHLHDCDWAAMHRAGVPVGDIEDLPRDRDGQTVAELRAEADVTEYEDGSVADAIADWARVLVDGGLDRIPAACAGCHFGRVVMSWHTYTKQVKGTIKRQCTGKYKVEPVERKIRELAGAAVWTEECRYCVEGLRIAPWDPDAGIGQCSVCRGTGERNRVGKVPAGVTVEQWIGFSSDEIVRVTTAGFPAHVTPRHPLIEEGLSSTDCVAFLAERGWECARSVCIGCPFHRNAFWRYLRDHRPKLWAQAVAFDKAFRHAPGLRARRFLHESCLPLDEAPIDRMTRKENASAQGNMLDLIVLGEPDVQGCSPYGCRSDELVGTPGGDR